MKKITKCEFDKLNIHSFTEIKNIFTIYYIKCIYVSKYILIM